MIIILSRAWFALSLLSDKMSSVSIWHLVDNCVVFDQLIFGIVSSWTRILIALHDLRFTLNRVGMSTFSDSGMLVIGSRGWQVLLVFRNYIRSLVFADLIRFCFVLHSLIGRLVFSWTWYFIPDFIIWSSSYRNCGSIFSDSNRRFVFTRTYLSLILLAYYVGSLT